jgi:arylsulfatase A-like enzyme
MTNMHYIAICLILLITFGLVGLPPFIASTRTDQSAFAQTLSVSGQQQQGQRPNILLIVGDDLGWSDIGAFGAEISTPNLDQLAKEGRIGLNYHTAPTCSPARAALLTGVDWHVGGLGNMYELIADNQKGKPGYETYLNNRVVTVQELLRDAGYHTIQSGKWHLSGSPIHPGTTPYERGFEYAFTLVGDGGNHFTNGSMFPGGTETFLENDTEVNRPGNGTLFSSDLYTDKMIEYINKTQDDGKPLFMYLAFTAAHSPFMAPHGTVEKYDQIYSAGWDKVREQRFEKQKELGIWPANMTLPQGLPPNTQWDSLTQEQQEYAVRLLAVRAAMIENMDQNVGRLIDHLKQTGQYNNTLIMYTSDNSGSEAVQLPEAIIGFDGVNYTAVPEFVKNLNHSLSNLGNMTTEVNYGPWGPYVSSTPFAGFKATLYEGGARAHLIIKEPNSATTAVSTTANTTSPIKGFSFVTDLTPTFLDYANVPQPQPGSTYNGTEVHPIMGKSLRPLLNGSVEEIHGVDDPIGSEMFNSTGVYKGPWLAMRPGSDPTGNWQLYNIVSDPVQNNNLAEERPDILQQMISDYQKYSEEVGIVIPTGKKAEIQYSKISPPLNQSQTIELDEIIPPLKRPNATDIENVPPLSS